MYEDLLAFLLTLGIAAVFTFAMLLFGSFTLGIFQKLRDSKAKVYGPFLEIFKYTIKQPSEQVTTSVSARRLVLLAWTVCTVSALLFIPYGSFSIMPNIFGDFQLFAIFGFLMVYPAGLMVLCFVSSRKASILNLRFLSEDFFSAFITFLLSMFSLLLIYHGSFNFTHFPSLIEMLGFQSVPFIEIGDFYLNQFFGLLNPLALVSFFATLPVIYQPFEFSDGQVSKKWTPLADFSAGSMAWVKVLGVFRFVVMIVLLLDVFAGGMQVTSTWYIDVPLFFACVVLVAVILAFVKLRSGAWLLDKKLSGFIRVHTIIALAGLVLSIVLVYS
nr:hypothetical protein [Candidatus Sigynarchaeota archaeon]